MRLLRRLRAGVEFVAMVALFLWLGIRNRLTPR